MLAHITNLFKSFTRDEKGQALTEYGLIIALVALLLVAGLGLLTGALQTLFTNIANAL